MLASFLIFFREGLEATLLLSIILTTLRRMGMAHRMRDIWLGAGLAVLVAAAGGYAVVRTIGAYDGSHLQTVLEGTTYLVAAVLLTYMTFWMKKQSRHLKRDLEDRLQGALSSGSVLSLAVLAFVTVGREGLETVVFTIAIALQTRPASLMTGAALGLLSSFALSAAVYRFGSRIRLGVFFNIMGSLLMLFAAGLLANGIADYQQLRWLPFWNRILWNTHGLLNQHTTFGSLLHGFFGYDQRPSLLQFAAYVTYLAVVMWRFWDRREPRPRAS